MTLKVNCDTPTRYYQVNVIVFNLLFSKRPDLKGVYMNRLMNFV